MKQVSITKDALRMLSRMPSNTARLIRAKIDLLARDPAAIRNNVTGLVGRPGEFRLRVGDWRVLFTEDDRSITVRKFAPRGAAYT